MEKKKSDIVGNASIKCCWITTINDVVEVRKEMISIDFGSFESTSKD